MFFTLDYILLYLLIIILFVCLGNIFERAGKPKWHGYVPGLNFYTWLTILKRPWWWLILLITPFVNFIMLVIMLVETGIVFGKRSTKEQWFFGALPWVAIPQLAFKDKSDYIGPREWNEKKKKSQPREWGEAILFAVVAATIIRTYCFEMYTIPTPSMESSMNVGDYLVVSKASYGAKSPMTPVALPLVHNRLPGSLTNSYVDWFKLPYYRLPGFGNPERMDAMVFNYPSGDTAIVHDYFMGHDYHQILRESAKFIASGAKTYPEYRRKEQVGINNYLKEKEKYLDLARKQMAKGIIPFASNDNQGKYVNIKTGGLVVRPVDKREHYIKRLVGMPGDKLEIKDRQVFIDDSELENPENLQYSYFFFPQAGFNKTAFAKKFGLHSKYQIQGFDTGNGNKVWILMCNENTLNAIQKAGYKVEPRIEEAGSSPGLENIFPNSNLAPFNGWNKDNYGPINIPKEGDAVNLTVANLPLYKRIIEAYEGNKLSVQDDKIFINGQETSTYTIKQNYYWLMGDNRHNSVDSRFWGFVPEDHVVGKAVITWFSKRNEINHFEPGIQWDRMFKTVK